MTAPIPDLRAQQREWNFVHILAALTISEVLLLFALNAAFAISGGPFDIPVALRVLGGVGAIALMWFWVRMLIDFFRERPATHPVAWGWALILGCYFGGIAYFFLVWRPRHRVGAA